MITTLLLGLVLFLLFYGEAPLGILLSAILVGLVSIEFIRRRNKRSRPSFLSIDLYAQQSRLREWNPGIKIATSVLVLFLCIFSSSGLVHLFIIATSAVVIVGLGRTPLHSYLALISLPITFLLISELAILIELSAPPDALLSLLLGSFRLSVTPASQGTGRLLLGRAIGGVGAVYMLSLTTPLADIIAFLHTIRLPKVLIDLMYLTYRYIFITSDTYSSMEQSARSRLGYKNKLAAVKTSIQNASNLLNITFRRASNNFDAMEARLYSGGLRFYRKARPINTLHLLSAVLYLAILIGLIAATGGGKA